MAIKFMGGAFGRNPTLTEHFNDSTYASYYIPFYIKVFTFVKQDKWIYTDSQAGLYLFGWGIYKIKDRVELT